MTEKTFKAGDAVRWDHSQGTTEGKVIRKVTKPMTIKGHKVAASKDNPEYLVESDKTGARAAHRPEELRKA
jgi:Hypervirulence associated proteins TUDOR domain